MTSWMSTKHSNHLSYASIFIFRCLSSIPYIGVDCNSYFQIFIKNVLYAKDMAKILVSKENIDCRGASC